MKVCYEKKEDETTSVWVQTATDSESGRGRNEALNRGGGRITGRRITTVICPPMPVISLPRGALGALKLNQNACFGQNTGMEELRP
ncbi:unnamed protein product [Linum trigynum]|uniref:Uncharacterized protein n=1 Tax=Linum trigynum TaxID=586398 RepID=A0AAV2D7K3_9ROSI